MANKFTKGDVLKIKTTGETVVALDYKVDHAGGIYNALIKSGPKQFADSVVTDELLCEGKIDGKFQKKYINESSLELATPTAQ